MIFMTIYNGWFNLEANLDDTRDMIFFIYIS